MCKSDSFTVISKKLELELPPPPLPHKRNNKKSWALRVCICLYLYKAWSSCVLVCPIGPINNIWLQADTLNRDDLWYPSLSLN